MMPLAGKLCAPRAGVVELTEFDGKRFALRSDEAFAPGQPLKVAIALTSEHVLELKSLGSVKRAEGGFEVRARAQTLRRDTRDALLAHFQPR